MKARVEWKRAPEFAEIAETLGVDTTDVMAALKLGDGFFVLYTTGTTDPDTARLWSTNLRRDADDVLVAVGVQRELSGGLEAVRDLIERELHEKLGEPS